MHHYDEYKDIDITNGVEDYPFIKKFSELLNGKKKWIISLFRTEKLFALTDTEWADELCELAYNNERPEMLKYLTKILNNNTFIIKSVTDLINDPNILEKEALYNKRLEEAAKKGKKLPTYQHIFNSTLLYLTLGSILIGIQTSIPSVRTRKTFPGCVRSFDGFPLQGEGDFSSLQYIACVLHKTTSSISIWESIKKYKPDVLVKRMRDIFDNFIMKRSDIMELYVKKREYILLYPELSSPLEHDLSKWRHFMPPIVPFELSKNIQNVASDFESDLMELFRKGSSRQNESINVLHSKMLLFGYNLINSLISLLLFIKSCSTNFKLINCLTFKELNLLITCCTITTSFG